jgi:signal transduction histidine kinase
MEFHQNGEVFWIELSFSFLKDANAKPIGLVTVVRDITARKKTEKELIAAKEKAQESDLLKTAFLNGVSHEIRTPMNGILGFASLLKELDLSGELKEEFIVSIEKSGNRMMETITNIIDTALIQSGQMAIVSTETNVYKLMHNTFGKFEKEAQAKGIQLSCLCPIETYDLILSTDEDKLLHILTHLIKNAIKFTDKGHVEFGYRLKKTTFGSQVGIENANFQLGTNPDLEQGGLEFFVKDTGIGIPIARQSAIFAPFEHADIANIRAFQGIGLGLSVSKAYIEMMGGEIRLESKEGEGSQFYFTIPMR